MDLVHGCRFLDRSLLKVVRDQLLAEGGVAIWSTFMEGEENLAPPFKTSRRLLPGELARTFSYERIDGFEDAEAERRAREREGSGEGGARGSGPDDPDGAAGGEGGCGGRQYRVVLDREGELCTRQTMVPAQFFAAVRRQ